LAPGQKRTAAGDFKTTLDPPAHNADASGAARRRSKSTGSSAYGSRIAQVTRSLAHSRVYSSFILFSCRSISVHVYRMQRPK
jgi:hypothetical protein